MVAVFTTSFVTTNASITTINIFGSIYGLNQVIVSGDVTNTVTINSVIKFEYFDGVGTTYWEGPISDVSYDGSNTIITPNWSGYQPVVPNGTQTGKDLWNYKAEFSEYSTIDVGNTTTGIDAVTFSFAISGTYSIFQVLTSTNYDVKAIIRAI